LYYDNGTLTLEIWDQNHEPYLYHRPFGFKENVWYNITYTVKNNVYLYINVNKYDLGAVAHSTIESIAKPLTIGKAYDSEFHQVEIDDIRIYNRSLSEPEVQQLYQGENSCTTNGVFTQVDMGSIKPR